jgi:hypothetical protein
MLTGSAGVGSTLAHYITTTGEKLDVFGKVKCARIGFLRNLEERVSDPPTTAVNSAGLVKVAVRSDSAGATGFRLSFIQDALSAG